MSAIPEEDPASRIRRLRSLLLRRAAGSGEPSRDGDDLLLREAVRRLHPAPMSQFLATDEGFLLTLDHRALTRNETPENMKRHRAEAADAIAVLAPHIKCAVTAAPLGTGPPASLVTPVTFSVAESTAPASPGGAADAAKAASAAPTTPEGFLRAAQQAVAGMPVPTTAPISPQALKVTVDAANTVASFLGGISGFNPARLSVSIFVSDVMVASASGRATLHRLSYIAAARVANARRLSLENAPMLSALDLAAAGLRTQARAVDDRAAMRGHRCALSTWVSQGAADGWLGTIHDAAKQPPVYSTDIASVVIDEQLPPLPAELAKLRLPGRRAGAAPTTALGSGKRVREPAGSFSFSTFDIVASPADEDEEAEVKETVGATVAASAHSSFDTIASEVDFMGTSNTARDVDRIFTFARTVCEGGLPVAALRRLMHERRQESQLDSAVPEPRPLLPAMATGDGLERIGGDDEDDDTGAAEAGGDAKHTVLERVAVDAAKAANDVGSTA